MNASRLFDKQGARLMPAWVWGFRLVPGLATLILFAGPTDAIAQTCPTLGQDTARVVAVAPRLELRLSDNRIVRLVGLDPALPTPSASDMDETVRSRFSATLTGQNVTFRAMSGAPDRWGRIPALVFVPGNATPGGVVGDAIAAGFGRFLAEPAAHDCRDALIRLEEKARAEKLGLWADPYYSVLAVNDRDGFSERAGTNVLAEGRLTAVQPGPYRTTLRFADPSPNSSGRASPGGHMLVATIVPRAMKTFDARRMDLQALIGQKIRIRGLLDLRFGPRIELASPDDIEAITAPREGAAPPPSP
jgi:endonuclease YncB( thermonuclease family)